MAGNKIRISGRREGQDERWVCAQALKLYGVENIKVGHSGWPDRVYLIPGGRLLWIEHKKAGENAMARQEWRLKRLQDLGYDAELVDDRYEALEAIRRKVDAAQIPKQGRSASDRKRRPRTAG